MMFKQLAIVPLTLAVSFLTSLTEAAPLHGGMMARDTATNGTLPPLIPSRCQSAGLLPGFDLGMLNMEDENAKANGDLPAGTKTVGSWAFSDPKNKSILSGLQGVTQASAVQVDAAILRAKLAASSYCRGVAPGGKWSCPHCDAVPDGKIVKTFKSKSSDTNGFILQSDSLQNFFIVFRGTNSIKSAIVDIKFKKVDYPPVKGSQVHDGFLKSYLEVQSDVILTMQSLMEQYPNYKIDVTGHSLGASQAMLGALDLYQRFESVTPSNLQIFTFGEPRTGNPHFASYMIDTKIPKFRVVNDNDLVPHLPAMSLGFVHSGLEYWIQNDKKTTQICKALFFENKKCSDSTPPFLNFFDHLSYFGITEGLCL